MFLGGDEGVAGSSGPARRTFGIQLKLEAPSAVSGAIHKVSDSGCRVLLLLDDIVQAVKKSVDRQAKPGFQVLLECHGVGMNIFWLEISIGGVDVDLIDVVLVVGIGRSKRVPKDVFQRSSGI